MTDWCVLKACVNSLAAVFQNYFILYTTWVAAVPFPTILLRATVFVFLVFFLYTLMIVDLISVRINWELIISLLEAASCVFCLLAWRTEQQVASGFCVALFVSNSLGCLPVEFSSTDPVILTLTWKEHEVRRCGLISQCLDQNHTRGKTFFFLPSSVRVHMFVFIPGTTLKSTATTARRSWRVVPASVVFALTHPH